MTDLIVENALVEVQNEQVVVSSKQVAEHFEKEHKHILESIREILAVENSTAKFFAESTFENRGKEYPMCLMNRKGFSLLAMGFTGSKALQWKIKYIEAFDAMEEMLKNQALNQQQPSYLIDDEIARAKKWIKEAQERKQLAETNQKLEQELEQEREFKNTVFNRGDCVSYTVAHKLIRGEISNINRTQFFQILRNKKIIGKNNLPQAKYEQKGYFKTKTTTIDYGDYTKDRIQGVVTPKGIDWLLQYFKKLFPQKP